MARMTELSDSRGGTVALAPEENARTLRYVADGCYDIANGSTAEDQVESLIESTVPVLFRGQRFKAYQIEPQGNGVYYVTVQYGRKKAPGTLTLEFDTSGERARITQSFGQVTYYGRVGANGQREDPIDFNGAIGIKSSNGVVKVEGIEVDVPAFAFVVKRTFGPDFPLTGEYVQLLRLCTKKVNADAIETTIAGVTFNFAPGELLFREVTGVQKSGGDYEDFEGELALRFAASDNLVNVEIAGIPGVTKRGWDQVEVIYEEDDSDLVLRPRARQVNVNQVFYEENLAGLFA